MNKMNKLEKSSTETKFPRLHIYIIAAISLDGFIAQKTEQVSTAWTSKEDFDFFVKKTKETGLLVMGSSTFETINRALTGRKIVVLSRTKTYPQFDKAQVDAMSGSLTEVLTELVKQGYTELAVCGGSSVYTQFLSENLVDEMYITIEPKAFGAGVPLFNQAMNVDLELIERILISDNSTVMHYKVK